MYAGVSAVAVANSADSVPVPVDVANSAVSVPVPIATLLFTTVASASSNGLQEFTSSAAG